MIRIALAIALFVPGLAPADSPADPATPPQWVVDARAAASELGTRLKQELRSALTESDPAGGVTICRRRAPEIADSISGPHLEVGRTALRVRNPANRPDDWERRVLETFRQRIEAGEDPSTLEHWQVTAVDGTPTGRWMKAIPMGPQCVLCHGGEIAEPLAETIAELYPEDQATGFRPGELRGAFTVEMDLAPADAGAP